MTPLPRGLYAITPDWTDTAALLRATESALQGGVTVLQYRNKQASPVQRKQQAQALKNLCDQYGAPLIINDHLDLALEVQAAGLHLGGEDGNLALARQALGPERFLGASCYNDLTLARSAQAAGASYMALGAIFPSASKPQAKHAPLSLLTEAKTLFSLPIVAIGGITPNNAAQVYAAGADNIAVIHALYSAENVMQAAKAMKHPDSA